MNASDSVYILHSRKYTDSKVILSFISHTYGRVDGVYRIPKRKGVSFITPQSFCLYSVSWSGNSQLKNIKSLESEGFPLRLEGTNMYCGLYVNELVQNLCMADDPFPKLYGHYQSVLGVLAESPAKEQVELALRLFELSLFDELGYAINFSNDALGEKIADKPEYLYRYSIQDGFVPCAQNNSELLFSGDVICKIDKRLFNFPDVRRSLKLICRLVVNSLLNGKPLKSRELF